MFSKILIANRGEIAVRIIRTCKRLGIVTVAVHSDADDGSLAMRMADEAVRIGPAPASESYLVGERILEAAKATGAEAIHPGFGFLSENADFARAVADAGLVFIGPPPDAISAMGDKIRSKKLAVEAGVSTVPGFVGEVEGPEHAVAIAKDIGYPVMIKASAGGGGKGMRIARDDDQMRDGLLGAMNEARGAFGDDRVFIEKFVEQPRHIEIQVLADTHGNAIHLGERECSIQRRHQKVIEEAPSPFIDAETRAAMGAQAVALAETVGYTSAGTVEFIADPDKNFYFLEMNTRLQVEHPVTEMTTGVDLVEQMIRVAAGERLAIAQDDVGFHGWAIESRVYAEDPVRNFVPSTGRLSRYIAPMDVPHVRIDSGIEEGSEISVFYDPMVAKLVTWGETREAAVDRMAAALDGFAVRGVANNVVFLSSVMAHPRFREGRLSTAFIEEEFAEGFSAEARIDAVRDVLVTVAAIANQSLAEREATLASGAPAFRRTAVREWSVVIEREREREVVDVGVDTRADGWRVEFGGRMLEVESVWRPGGLVFRGHIDDRTVTVQVDRDGTALWLTHGGARARLRVMSRRAGELLALLPVKEPPDTSKLLISPMPGLLVRLSVEEGQEVEAGQELAVVEAMKMENVLRAERHARVKRINVGPGDSLATDQVIVEFE